MEIDRSVVVGFDSAGVRDRIVQYFTGLRYRLVPGGELRFQRGSSLGSMIRIDPRKWRSDVSVKLARGERGLEVRSVWRVNTTGQILTRKDRSFWLAEADDLERILHSAGHGPVQSGRVAKEIVSDRVTRTGVRLVVWVVFLVAITSGLLVLPWPWKWLIALGVAIVAGRVAGRLVGRRAGRKA